MELRNRLLRALPADTFDACIPHFEPVRFKARQVLHFKGIPVEHCYFIEEGLVSVLADVGDGEVVEAWLIGIEGVVGLPVILGGTTSPFRRVAAVGGRGFRVPTAVYRDLLAAHAPMRDLMFAYVQAVAIQAGQSVACAKRHNVQQRLARWLLSAQYRLGSDALPLTHAMLSRLLGIRRVTVTVALGGFEEAGLIELRRGTIVIRDGATLTAQACSCHAIIRAAYDRIALEK